MGTRGSLARFGLQPRRWHGPLGMLATLPLLSVALTGAILAAKEPLTALIPKAWGDPWPTLYHAHRSLCAGESGKILMSLTGIAVAALWYSGYSRLQGGRRRRLTLHARLGAYLGLVLACICLLGSVLNFSEPLANWLDPLPPLAVPPSAAPAMASPQGGAAEALAAATATADQLHKRGDLVQVYRPKPGKPYYLFFYRDDTRIYVAPPTGQLLKIRAPGRHWTSALFPLHTLKPLGRFGKVLLFALAASLLALTGRGLRHLAFKATAGRRRRANVVHEALGR